MKLTAPTANLSSNEITYFPYSSLDGINSNFGLNSFSLPNSENLIARKDNLLFFLTKGFRQSIVGQFYKLFTAPVL